MAMPQRVPVAAPETSKPFSPIDDSEPLMRWQRAVHLAPSTGLGVGRRAVLLGAITWLPITLWALLHGRFFTTPVGESLLQHYGVHVRCLVVIPLFIIGEATLQKAALRYFPQFVASGLVDDATRPAFEAAINTARRWRDASLPWLSMIGFALAVTFADRATKHVDEMSWALDSNGMLGFGGFWFAYIVRPIFIALLLGWLWRIVLLAALFMRLSRLRLSFAPSHPDRAGGIGFLEGLPTAFAPVTFALSAMIASRWAHQIVYHGMTLASVKIPASVFVVVWSLLLFAPLVPLIPALWAAKRVALPSYAAMVAQQGRDVRRRWIDGTWKAEGALLQPDGIGVIADAATMYGQVRAMRLIPIGRPSLYGILLPIAVPMLIVVSLKIPIKTVLLGLLKTVM
nr:hypothetical protein Hi04_10k_c3826_00005 [uncultured bacterium]